MANSDDDIDIIQLENDLADELDAEIAANIGEVLMSSPKEIAARTIEARKKARALALKTRKKTMTGAGGTAMPLNDLESKLKLLRMKWNMRPEVYRFDFGDGRSSEIVWLLRILPEIQYVPKIEALRDPDTYLDGNALTKAGQYGDLIQSNQITDALLADIEDAVEEHFKSLYEHHESDKKENDAYSEDKPTIQDAESSSEPDWGTW